MCSPKLPKRDIRRSVNSSSKQDPEQSIELCLVDRLPHPLLWTWSCVQSSKSMLGPGVGPMGNYIPYQGHGEEKLEHLEVTGTCRDVFRTWDNIYDVVLAGS